MNTFRLLKITAVIAQLAFITNCAPGSRVNMSASPSLSSLRSGENEPQEPVKDDESPDDSVVVTPTPSPDPVVVTPAPSPGPIVVNPTPVEVIVNPTPIQVIVNPTPIQVIVNPTPVVVINPQPPVVVVNPTPPVVVNPPPPVVDHVTPTPPPAKVVIYRFFNTQTRDQLLSRNRYEVVDAPWEYLGEAFQLMRDPGPGLHAIRRCLNVNEHFVSRETYCENRTSEGILGYAATAQVSHTALLIRAYDAFNGVHLATVDESEGPQSGYMNEGPLGYVWSPGHFTPAPRATPQLQTIFRSYNPHIYDHLFSLSSNEGYPHGYYSEPETFQTSKSLFKPGLVLLKRCLVYTRHGMDHFLSTDERCEGQIHDGEIGYVSLIPLPGMKPLFRSFHKKVGRHLVSLDQGEGPRSGFTDEGVLAYVW